MYRRISKTFRIGRAFMLLLLIGVSLSFGLDFGKGMNPKGLREAYRLNPFAISQSPAFPHSLSGTRGIEEAVWFRAHLTGSCVAFSPDGKLVATPGGFGTIFLFNVSDGSIFKILLGQTGWANSIAFSPNGDLLAIGSSDGTIKLWRVSDGTYRNTLAGGSAITIAFSPDGSLIASGGWDGIALWRKPLSPDDTTPPTVPANLKAKAVSSSEIDLSWDASTDIGAAGLAGYSIERRIQGGSFLEIAKVDAQTTNYKDTGLSTNTIYEYRVRAYDNAKNYSDYSNTVLADVTPPTIVFLSPHPPESSQEVIKVSNVVLLSAKVTDPILVPEKVQFRIDTYNNFVPYPPIIPILTQFSDEFLCIVKLEQGDYRLKVVAEDTCGNKAEQSVNFRVIDTPSLPSANTVFISLPFKALADNLQNIIIYVNSAYWSMNKYILLGDPNFPTDLTCKGFWVKLPQAFDPSNVDPDGSSSPADQEIAVPLGKGWQAIGLPWTYPLPISALQIEDKNGNRFSFSQASNLVGKVLFRWNGTEYVNVGLQQGMENTLYPWFGYWIRVKDDCKLIFPKEPWTVQAKRASNLDGFCLPIKAVFSDGTTEDVYIGIGKEEITSPFPPPAPYSQNLKRLSIIKNGELLYIDIRKEGGKQEWRLAVKGGATLFFPNLSYLPKGWQAISTDGDKRYYLKTTSAIKVEGDKELKVEIGDGLVTPLLINMVEARSVRGGVNISWNVNLPCQAKVAIKGADGRVLRDLGMRSSSSGLNSIFWDGKGQDGRNLPAGIYIIELTARDDLNQMIKAIRMVNLR